MRTNGVTRTNEWKKVHDNKHKRPTLERALSYTQVPIRDQRPDLDRLPVSVWRIRWTRLVRETPNAMPTGPCLVRVRTQTLDLNVTLPGLHLTPYASLSSGK